MNGIDRHDSQIDDIISNNIEHIEPFTSYCNDKENLNTDVKKHQLYQLLWPKPQIIQINSNTEDKFYLPNEKNIYIYVKPPNTYRYIDFMNRLTNVYSSFKFVYINKEINEPYIVINIDKVLFNTENSYSITIKNNVIYIDSYDIQGLQYALCTFLQLCKIYPSSIPAIKVS